MCGVVGFMAETGSVGVAEERIRVMTRCLAHRGPDSTGMWCDERAEIALGHRRLAIVDLSPLGAQPMASASGRWIVVLNGEIYNYKTLRGELAALGHAFRGTSDTEVLLAGFEQWGVIAAIQRSEGMFAMAVWDVRERELYLIRDRLGEKPLYVGEMGNTLLFGSELKALRQHPAWQGHISATGLRDLLRFAYVPSYSCIYEDVRKVEPGTIERYQASGGGRPVFMGRTAYWSASEVAQNGADNRFTRPTDTLINELEELLSSVIGDEMVADVPLGAFLSGGIDSSLIVALMQRQGSSSVRTFSIGFDASDYNEAHHAKAVARHLGTEHTELYVSPSDAMEVIPQLPGIYDEPFADSSQIPTYLVAKLARTRVTVALSGDGGDEAFGGYNRYAWMERIWRRLRAIPLPLRRVAARAMTAFPPEFWDGVGGAVGRIAPSLRMRTYGDKVHKLSRMLSLRSKQMLYEEIVSSWSDPRDVLRYGLASQASQVRAWPKSNMTFGEQMMLADVLSYLPDDILVKVDRASMAVSLETRAPFLHHKVLEFAARLPYEVKVRGNESKWILRELLYRHVPRALIDRPKMGFGVPVHAWLRGPLRPWAEELLDQNRLRAEGFFEPSVVAATWQAHVGGRVNAVPQLWPILMFQAWLTEQGIDRRERSAA